MHTILDLIYVFVTEYGQGCTWKKHSNSHVIGAEAQYHVPDEDSCKKGCEQLKERLGIDWKYVHIYLSLNVKTQTIASIVQEGNY